jgi:DinB superfamily
MLERQRRHALLFNVEIDAMVDKLVVNGVDVTAYVNDRDPWHPLRSMLRASTPENMRLAWATLEDEWAKPVSRAHALPEASLHESVNGEFTFVQTLRHLVFAMDKWFTSPVLGEPFDPIGLPTGSLDFPWPGLDDDLTPSVSEALAVRADRATRLRDYLASVAASDLTRPVDVLENGSNPLQDCIWTVFEEEFWHNRYAVRDLEQLEASTQDQTARRRPLWARELGVGFVQLVGTFEQHGRASLTQVVEARQECTQGRLGTEDRDRHGSRVRQRNRARTVAVDVHLLSSSGGRTREARRMREKDDIFRHDPCPGAVRCTEIDSEPSY